jgi:hypothetical protein
VDVVIYWTNCTIKLKIAIKKVAVFLTKLLNKNKITKLKIRSEKIDANYVEMCEKYLKESADPKILENLIAMMLHKDFDKFVNFLSDNKEFEVFSTALSKSKIHLMCWRSQ